MGRLYYYALKATAGPLDRLRFRRRKWQCQQSNILYVEKSITKASIRVSFHPAGGGYL